MHAPRTHFRRVIEGWLFASLLFVFPLMSRAQPAVASSAKDTEVGTPAYSYYLAEGIIQSYRAQFQIDDTFQKKPISANLKPRNVFARTLKALEEFETLYPGALSPQQRDAAYAINVEHATPTEITGMLTLIRNELERQGVFREYGGPRSAKTPSEVYEQIRKLGWFHRQIAAQRQLDVTWDSADRVYTCVVRDIAPTVYAIADQNKAAYTPYAFPKQPSRDIQPRNIYKLVMALYANIMRADTALGNAADAVIFTEITECDEITPADVFDLQQIVVAELAVNHPNAQPSAQFINQFTNWKASQEKLVPGHTFRLLQHLYLLTEDLLAQGM